MIGALISLQQVSKVESPLLKKPIYCELACMVVVVGS
jgi:hypothetical protein